MTFENLIISSSGFKVIKDTTAHSGNYAGFVAWDDTVISELDINGVAADLADYGLDGTTIPMGMPVFFATDKLITRIKLTSGSLYLVNRPYIKY